MPGENAFSKIGDAAHRQDRGPEVLAIIDCLAILAALFVFLRLLSRRISKTTLWVCKINKSVRGVTDLISTKFDDYLVMLALIICGAAVGLAVRAVQHGTGKHMHPHTHHRHHQAIIEALKITWASQFLYTWCLATTKLSLVFQLWRIFNVMERFRIAAYTLSALISLWAIACTIVGFLECRPISAFWLDPGSDSCISAEKYLFANGIPNTLIDLLLIITPLPFVFKLGFIRTWQRLGIMLTFALGGFTIIVGIYRLKVVYAHKSTPDATWSFTNIIIWSAVEYSVAIVCACIPSLAPLVRTVLQRVYRNPSVTSLRKTVSHRLSNKAKVTVRLQKPRPVARARSEARLAETWIGDEQVLLCGRAYEDVEQGLPMEVVLTKHALN